MASRDKESLTGEVWRRLFAFFMSTRHHRDLVLERLGLTPNDARAFSSLSDEAGRTMHSLADEWGCDASNATWIVDRLERRGFVERRTPADRRVKLVVMTPLGSLTKTELLSGMNQPPPELTSLSYAELTSLYRLLLKLPTEPVVDSSRED